MAKGMRTEPFIWITWALFLFGWFLMLAGVAALQQNCTSDTHFAITQGGVSGYQGPVECKKFYSYPWWITWYLFLLVLLVAGLAATKGFPSFRAGALGLLALGTMLAGDTANTFLQWNHLGMTKTATDRARTTAAGAIIASIGLYILIILIGLVDEKGEKVAQTGEPKGQTYGGRYVPSPGTEQQFEYGTYGGRQMGEGQMQR